ncbi:MAG: endonuclease/exonuclease/phosphatase family protein [Candidatus Binataceae bacterium]|nr:endonuclease/exonuclease/phosphatase family protein [Candidatus Binataceae bacterium]
MAEHAAAAARENGHAQFPPIVVNRASAGSRLPLRVTVLNAKGGAHLEEIAARLARPPLADTDLLLLCEAGWRSRRSARREVARELADRLGMSFAFGPVWSMPGRREGSIGSSIGNAILSSQPLEDVRVVPMRRYWRADFARIPGAPNGVIATVRFGGIPITICIAHLESRASPQFRAEQMRSIAEAIPPTGAAIIGGDFNTTTIELGGRRIPIPIVRALLMRRGRRCWPQKYEPLFKILERCGFAFDDANVPGIPTFTFSRMIPPFVRPKLDWLGVRGLAVVKGSATVVPARGSFFAPRFSDHDFITCQVRQS